jgi:hypothetical protein
MERAAAAHGTYEEEHGGEYDVNWPIWYAKFLEREQGLSA